MNNLKIQFRAYLLLSWYAFRAQTRNKATFAFGFIFPIVFISIFGLVGSGNQKVNLGIPSETNMNNPVVKVVSTQTFVKVRTENQPVLEKELKEGKLSGILVIKNESDAMDHFTVNLLTSSANPIEAAKITTFIKGVVDESNLKISGITVPPVVFLQTEISGRQSRYIDFALPGQIGFSLLSTAVFGTVFGLIYLKKALILKRMIASPVKPIIILLSQGTSRLFLGLIQTTMIITIGVWLFHFYLPHGFETYIQMLILSTIGLISFLGFGYFMSGFAKDENSAGPLVNLITLPQFLLCGTFFPIDNLPSWLQPIASNLPLAYFNIGMRKITVEGSSLLDIWPYILGLTAYGVIMYVLAARYFKWEP